MKKMLVITAAIAAALVLPACSGGGSSSSASKTPTPTPTVTEAPDATDPLAWPISLPEPSGDHFTAADLEVLTHQVNPDAVRGVQVVLHIDSAELSEELISDFFFNEYLPVYESLEATGDNYMTEGYIVFDDVDGGNIASNLGVRITWSGGLISAFEYLDYDPTWNYDANGYISPDVKFYTIDTANHTVTYDGDISILSEDEKIEWVVAPY